MKHPFATPAAAVPASAKSQRGATLIIGLIMLTMISLIVVGAFTLSSANLKSVGNMQMRSEAIAAASAVIETRIEQMTNSSKVFTVVTGAVMTPQDVDIDKNGKVDYQVVASFNCIKAIRAADASGSDVELGVAMTSASEWNTEWDINATVTDVGTGSGAAVEMHEGVKVRLLQAEKDTACP